MRRRDIVADRYDDPNIGTPADGRLRVNGIINAATGWKANWGPACSFLFRGGDRMDVKWHVLSTAGGIIWRLGDLDWSFYPRLRAS